MPLHCTGGRVFLPSAGGEWRSRLWGAMSSMTTGSFLARVGSWRKPLDMHVAEGRGVWSGVLLWFDGRQHHMFRKLHDQHIQVKTK